MKQQESGRTTKEICREAGISEATFYNWKSKYGGMEASDVKRLKDLELENARLKKMYAEAAMDNQIPKELFAKRLGPATKRQLIEERLLAIRRFPWSRACTLLSVSCSQFY